MTSSTADKSRDLLTSTADQSRDLMTSSTADQSRDHMTSSLASLPSYSAARRGRQIYPEDLSMPANTPAPRMVYLDAVDSPGKLVYNPEYQPVPEEEFRPRIL
jgi:hypothetical protein